jgi:hypothetical protein
MNQQGGSIFCAQLSLSPRVMKDDGGTPPSPCRHLHDNVRALALGNNQPDGPLREQREQQPLSNLGAVLSRNPPTGNVHYSSPYSLSRSKAVTRPMGPVGRPRQSMKCA